MMMPRGSVTAAVLPTLLLLLLMMTMIAGSADAEATAQARRGHGALEAAFASRRVLSEDLEEDPLDAKILHRHHRRAEGQDEDEDHGDGDDDDGSSGDENAAAEDEADVKKGPSAALSSFAGQIADAAWSFGHHDSHDDDGHLESAYHDGNPEHPDQGDGSEAVDEKDVGDKAADDAVDHGDGPSPDKEPQTIVADHLRASLHPEEAVPHESILKAHRPKPVAGAGDDLLWFTEPPSAGSLATIFALACVAVAFQRSARLRFAVSRIFTWARRRLAVFAPRLAARIRGLAPSSQAASKRASGRSTPTAGAGAGGAKSAFSLPRAKLSDLQDHVSALASSVTKKGSKPETPSKHTEMQSLARMGTFKPQRKDMPAGFRSVVSEEAMESIVRNLPDRLTAMNWSLLYASEIHGYNLTTAYQKAQGHGPFLIAVMDMNRYVFGAFSNESLKCGARQYYGTGESFIFQLEPAFRCHRWSGGNSQFVLSTKDLLAFGGGGHFALYLDAMFEQGSSEAGSTTFEPYECLASSPRFKCCAVEIWGFVSPMLSSPKRRARPFPTFR